jgi:hypothetical protein
LAAKSTGLAEELLRDGAFLVVFEDAPHWHALAESGHDLLGQIDQRLLILLLASALAQLVDALLHAVEVGQHQLGLDGRNVVRRIDLAFDVDDVLILEAAHHVDDRVNLADVRQELVAKSFAFARTTDQAGNIDDFEHCGHDDRCLDDAGKFTEARIGHENGADVWFDGAERVVGGFGLLGRDGIEQRRFADIGQTDNAAAE